MNFESWLVEGRLRPHKTTKKEIQELLGIAKRDLDDAAIQGLSTDRRFFIAYDAALRLATIPMYCVGYETHGQGHHWLTYKIFPDIIGKEHTDLAEYFDLCRTKRHIGTYDRGGQISENEVEELLAEVRTFQGVIEDWLRRYHSDYI